MRRSFRAGLVAAATQTLAVAVVTVAVMTALRFGLMGIVSLSGRNGSF